MKISNSPCAILLAAFAVGIILIRAGVSPLLTLLPAGVGIGLLVFLRIQGSRSATASLAIGKEHWWWCFLIFISLGMAREAYRSSDTLDFANLKPPVALTGVVQGKSTLSTNERLTIALNTAEEANGSSYPISGKICVYSNPTAAVPGDIVRIPYDLQKSDNEYLNREGISYTQRCKNSDIRIEGQSNSLTIRTAKWRNEMEASLHKSGISPATAKLLSALLLGDRQVLDPELKESFSRAGIAHILALSGMHLAIIASFCFWLLMPIGAIAGRQWKIILTILVLWCFALITGLSPTVVRACIMATFCMLALLFERKNSSLNSLCAAALIILFFDPNLLYNAGMQFSFVTVAALILLLNPAERINRRKHSGLHFLVKSICATMIATIASFGLTAHYFHHLPLLFPIANLILLPLLPLFIGLAILLLFTQALGLPISGLPTSIDLIADFFGFIAGKVSEIEWGNLFFAISGISAFVYTAGILILTSASKTRKLRTVVIGTAVVLVSVVLMLTTDSGVRPDGRVISYNSSLRTYSRGEVSDYYLPEKGYWKINLPGSKIIGICDNEISKTEKKRDRGKHPVPPLPIHTKQCDVLIVGRGYRGSLPHLLRYYSPKRIVVLNDVWRSYAAELKAEGKALGVDVHCIGFDGECEL